MGDCKHDTSKFSLTKKIAGEDYYVLQGWILTDLVEDWRECLRKHAPDLIFTIDKEDF